MTDERDAIERLLELAGPRRPPAGDHYDRARETARAAWLDEVRRARRARVVRVAAVSLAAAGMVVMILATWRHGSPAPANAPTNVLVATHNGAPLLRGATLQTDAATRTALQLVSGIEVRLDVDSEIALADAAAISLVRGAVFVDTGSATGPNRSLEVRTSLGTARDIGTRFEVRLLDDLPADGGSPGNTATGSSAPSWRPPPGGRSTSSGGKSMRVRVRDGVVRVTTPRGAENAGRGIELVATGAGGITRAEAPITGEEWDWVTLAAAPFDLDGKTLADFLAWVTREGGWDVRFQTAALARSASTIVISGSVDGLTPEQALRAVLATCGLTHRRDGDVITIEGGRS